MSLNGRTWLWFTTSLLLLGSCSPDTAAPRTDKPPYLAVVTLARGPQSILDTASVRYHIVQLSNVTRPLDTTISRPISDTLIVPVDPSTYEVTLLGLPAQCTVRGGPDATVVLFEGENTGLARYPVECTSALEVVVSTAGLRPDSLFVWQVTGPAAQSGVVGVNDTLILGDLPAGSYAVSVRSLKASCVATSDGGNIQQVNLTDRGGSVISFNFLCSDPVHAPTISGLAASYHDGATAFVVHAADPDRDLSRYAYQLTRCDGTAVLSPALNARDGLNSGRTENADTMTIVGVFLADLGSTQPSETCASIRVEDNFSNSSSPIERPLNTTRGRPPVVSAFNAVLSGSSRVVTQLHVDDPDGDFVGVFVMARLLDGTLGGTQDGKDDIGIYNVQGYLGASVPDLTLGGRIAYGQVLAVVVYAVDAEGNFTRVEDADLFQ